MANTYKLLASSVLTSPTATITFSSIPTGYTDLVIRTSLRSNVAGIVAVDPDIFINGSTSAIYSYTYLQGNGATASSSRVSGNGQGGWRYGANDTGSTTNTFAVSEFYFPSYLTSQAKPYSLITATENNATTGYINSLAQLYNSTSAISTITLSLGGGSYNFDTGSSFYLYGVYSGTGTTLPSTPTIGTATATGVTTATVAFTPTSATNVDASYTALSSPGSIATTGTSSPITVSGLTTGTAYTFQVRANNPGGSSAYSSASNSVTPNTAYSSIASITPSGTSTVTFSSIPQNFKILQIRASFGDTGTNTLNMTFNGDTTSSYQSATLEGNGTTVAGNAGYSNATMQIAFRYYGGSSNASYLGGAIIDIPNYATSGTYKTCLSYFGVNQNTVGRLGFSEGVWFNTAAITSITLLLPSNYSSGTVFSLYGIG